MKGGHQSAIILFPRPLFARAVIAGPQLFRVEMFADVVPLCVSDDHQHFLLQAQCFQKRVLNVVYQFCKSAEALSQKFHPILAIALKYDPFAHPPVILEYELSARPQVFLPEFYSGTQRDFLRLFDSQQMVADLSERLFSALELSALLKCLFSLWLLRTAWLFGHVLLPVPVSRRHYAMKYSHCKYRIKAKEPSILILCSYFSSHL